MTASDGLESGPRIASDTTAHALEKYLPLPWCKRNGIALCLSGGGSRAALFELGVLRRLNEVGVLSHVDQISCVSGGSILGAHLAAAMSPWPDTGTVFPDFEARIARPFEAFVRRNLRTAPVARRVLLPWNWIRDAAAVEALVDLFGRYLTTMRLVDLPTRPQFIFCASDNAFGVGWTMTASKVGSEQAGWAPTPPSWSVARAVAASSCFPPVFNPMPISIPPSEFSDGAYPAGPERDRLIEGLRLSDGGLYDNLALEPVWHRAKVVISIDGGATFDPEADEGLLRRTRRYVAIMGRQVTETRKRWLIANMARGIMSGVYIGVGSKAENYPTAGDRYSGAVVDEVIEEVRTDLDAFSDAEIKVLQNHGYLMAQTGIEAHLSRALAMIGVDPLPMEVEIPYPDLMDEATVRRELASSSEVRILGRGSWLPYLFRR